MGDNLRPKRRDDRMSRRKGALSHHPAVESAIGQGSGMVVGESGAYDDRFVSRGASLTAMENSQM